CYKVTGVQTCALPISFPKQASDYNGFGIVDVVNTVTVGIEIPGGGGPLPLGRMQLGEDFLFGRGNAYVSVIWEKFTVDTLRNGRSEERRVGKDWKTSV